MPTNSWKPNLSASSAHAPVLESEGRRALLAHVTPPATVGELASAIGVTPAAVSQWIAGYTAPSRKNAATLERLTGIPAGAWLADVERAKGDKAEQAAAAGEGVAK